MKMTLASKIDGILKVSIVVSVVFASCSVGYYYLVHLPRRNVQIAPQGALEDFRFAGASAQAVTLVNPDQSSKKTKRRPGRRSEQHTEQEPPLFEQKVSEQQASEQKAIEQRQALAWISTEANHPNAER
jgi:hypothetical protein